MDTLRLHDEALQKVGAIVRDTLEGHFHGRLTFPVVDATRDKHDDEDRYVYITIVLDGNMEQFGDDEEWAIGWLTNLRDKLVDSGVDAFPLPSLIERSEWEEMNAGN